MVFNETVYGDVVTTAPNANPSRKTRTPATGAGMFTVAVTGTVPDRLWPGVGWVIVTVDGGGEFETVIETVGAKPTGPLVCVAWAPRVCWPLLTPTEFHDHV